MKPHLKNWHVSPTDGAFAIGFDAKQGAVGRCEQAGQVGSVVGEGGDTETGLELDREPLAAQIYRIVDAASALGSVHRGHWLQSIP